jgi:hypothetical protein
MLELNLFILCPNKVQETAKQSGCVSQGIFERITFQSVKILVKSSL